MTEFPTNIGTVVSFESLHVFLAQENRSEFPEGDGIEVHFVSS